MEAADSRKDALAPPRLHETTLADALTALRSFVGVASISAHRSCLQEGADASAQILRDCGMHVTELAGPGAPVVLGEIPAPEGAPTALFYGHYDVQPADPLEEWSSPPFTADLRDGAVFGRGAGDNKGQLLAHLFAIRELVRGGSLGTGVKVLVEGEEEIGSPTVGEVVAAHRERLTADVAITADAALPPGEQPAVIFGVRGLLYVEMHARGASTDLHSGNRGGLAPYPAWELVQALASLRADDGRVLIPGFYDAVRPPAAAEREMVRKLPFDGDALAQELGIAELPPGVAEAGWEKLMFEPTLNIAGIAGGYDGPGAKTVIPAQARCKIDLRLVADQDPEEIYDALVDRVHSVAPGVRVSRLASVPPSATSPDSPWVEHIVAAVERATGMAPTLRPRMGGTTPDWVFTRLLEIPSVLIPYGPPDMNHHAPNERMTVAALERGILCSREILRGLAG